MADGRESLKKFQNGTLTGILNTINNRAGVVMLADGEEYDLVEVSITQPSGGEGEVALIGRRRTPKAGGQK